MVLKYHANRPDWLLEEQKLTIGSLVSETDNEYFLVSDKETRLDFMKQCVVFFRGAGRRPDFDAKERMLSELGNETVETIKDLVQSEYNKYTKDKTDYDRVKNFLAFIKGFKLKEDIDEGRARPSRDSSLVKR